jgi:hypothetical protein
VDDILREHSEASHIYIHTNIHTCIHTYIRAVDDSLAEQLEALGFQTPNVRKALHMTNNDPAAALELLTASYTGALEAGMCVSVYVFAHKCMNNNDRAAALKA